jgi:hypothetical protein
VEQHSPFIRLSFIDSSDSAAGVNAWIRTGSTVADGESAAATLTSVVGALSDAVIISRHIVYRGVEDPRPDAPGVAPGAGAGVFVFSCEDPDSYAVVVVPGIRQDLLVIAGAGAGVLIDQTNADVTTFRDAMISGIWSNPFGVQLLELVAAFYQWRP